MKKKNEKKWKTHFKIFFLPPFSLRFCFCRSAKCAKCFRFCLPLFSNFCCPERTSGHARRPALPGQPRHVGPDRPCWASPAMPDQSSALGPFPVPFSLRFQTVFQPFLIRLARASFSANIFEARSFRKMHFPKENQCF